MKGVWIKYSANEMAWLEANRAMVIGDYAAAFNRTFGRDVSAQNLHALRKRKGWKTGRTGCFVQGQEPPNKGKTMPYHPNSAATRFKKGNTPHTYRGPGHESIDPKDGYVILIVAETNPHTGAATRPVHKHRWLWEKRNGPVPAGHCLKCLDGDKTNTDPANWVCIPRGVLPRINGGKATRVMAYDAAPEELKPAILTMARVEQRAHELRRKDQAA